MRQGPSKGSALALIIIVGAAAGLSVLSYQFSTNAATQITDIASQDARSNAKIQVHDLSGLLGNKVESVTARMAVIANSQYVLSDNVEKSAPLFTAAKGTVDNFASTYFWVNSAGKLVWADSFTNSTTAQKYIGGDRSSRDYFTVPKNTHLPYYSTLIESVDNIPRLYIAYPILDNQSSPGHSQFKGVIAAAIDLNVIGKYVKDRLLPDYPSSLGLLDRNGLVLYSSNSPQYAGKAIFGPEVQSVLSVLPNDVRTSFNDLIRASLQGKAGSGDFAAMGSSSTVAYEPVVVQGNEFAILFIVTPHVLAGNALTLIEQQRTLNLIIIGAIGGIAAGIAILVLLWNSRLGEIVKSKTAQLNTANESLRESNVSLQQTNSQLAQANEQLKVHDKLQKEFVNVAAHELRTPIQPLLGAAEIMESQFENREKIEVSRAEVEMIVRNAKRLERLSSDILEVSRIESGALKLNKERFSLSYIIADALKDARARSAFDPDALSINYVPDSIFVQADKEKISEVLSNLLINAIKFTKRGSIEIQTREDRANNIAIVTIKDTGKGIDSAIIPNLFAKFVTKGEKGTGLGLYISKKIVEAHGGRIWGQNNEGGRSPGATFGFEIPLADVAAATPAPEEAPDNKSRYSHHRTADTGSEGDSQ